MKRSDWDNVVLLARELAGTAEDWTSLAQAVGARVGGIARKTFCEGLERETGETWATYDAFQRWARGDNEETLSPLAEMLRAYLTKRANRDRAHTLRGLCEVCDRSPSSILAATDELYCAGYAIDVQDEEWISLPSKPLPSKSLIPMYSDNNVFRFGLVSDTHLGNRNARLDVLGTLYDLFEAEGIETVLHAGNLLDGESKYNAQELLAHGVEGQIVYLYEHYPLRKGITTRFISTDCHTGWWSQGIGFDLGRHIENQCRRLGRDDLQWLGHVEVDLQLHPDNPQAVLRMMHPGGGASYAISYSVQKHVESWQSGQKPSAAIFGHYHKAGYFYPREVHTWLAGCVCDQTAFMRKLKLAAHVGGWMIEIYLTAMGGVSRVRQEFIPFYNASYYQSWDFQSMYAD